ncbi:MAG: hypothetical protein ACI3XD_08890 [Oscillospiraceae bacterium]
MNMEAHKNERRKPVTRSLKRRIIAGVFLVLAVVFLILSIVYIRQGFDKKDHYFNSDDYYFLNENAYVGGDAYNYIINGTYFTGYCALGGTMMICACIFVVAAVWTALGDRTPKKGKDQKETVAPIEGNTQEQSISCEVVSEVVLQPEENDPRERDLEEG